MRLLPLAACVVLLVTNAASAAQPILIKDVATRTVGAKTTIRVIGSGAPDFAVYRLSQPDRLVVDLSNAKLRGAQRFIDVGSWAVGQLAVSPIHRSRGEGVRVAVALRRAATTNVQVVGGAIEIVVKSLTQPPKGFVAKRVRRRPVAPPPKPQLAADGGLKRALAESRRKLKALQSELDAERLRRAKEQQRISDVVARLSQAKAVAKQAQIAKATLELQVKRERDRIASLSRAQKRARELDKVGRAAIQVERKRLAALRKRASAAERAAAEANLKLAAAQKAKRELEKRVSKETADKRKLAGQVAAQRASVLRGKRALDQAQRSKRDLAAKAERMRIALQQQVATTKRQLARAAAEKRKQSAALAKALADKGQAQRMLRAAANKRAAAERLARDAAAQARQAKQWAAKARQDRRLARQAAAERRKAEQLAQAARQASEQAKRLTKRSNDRRDHAEQTIKRLKSNFAARLATADRDRARLATEARLARHDAEQARKSMKLAEQNAKRARDAVKRMTALIKRKRTTNHRQRLADLEARRRSAEAAADKAAQTLLQAQRAKRDADRSVHQAEVDRKQLARQQRAIRKARQELDREAARLARQRRKLDKLAIAAKRDQLELAALRKQVTQLKAKLLRRDEASKRKVAAIAKLAPKRKAPAVVPAPRRPAQYAARGQMPLPLRVPGHVVKFMGSKRYEAVSIPVGRARYRVQSKWDAVSVVITGASPIATLGSQAAGGKVVSAIRVASLRENILRVNIDLNDAARPKVRESFVDGERVLILEFAR